MNDTNYLIHLRHLMLLNVYIYCLINNHSTDRVIPPIEGTNVFQQPAILLNQADQCHDIAVSAIRYFSTQHIGHAHYVLSLL